MISIVHFCRRWRWINVPGALLVALLQRTPALRVVAAAEELVVASPLGALLRSAVAATATLGAMHSLAGATQFVQNPGNPVTGTVGQTVSVSFTIVGSPMQPIEFFILDPLPPGLTTVPAMQQGNRVPSGTPTITGTPTQAGSFNVTVRGSDGAFSQDDVLVFQIAGPAGGGGSAPIITAQPIAAQAAAPGASASFTVGVSGTPAPTIQWQRNGVDLFGATNATFTVDNMQPANAGIYRAVMSNASGSVTSNAAILGVATTSKVTGAGSEVGADIVFSNGNIFDQVLLQGAAATVAADPGQIVRISYLDLNDDIVQVEFTGAGTLTLLLDVATGPAPPEKYNQSVTYMKGHATIVVTGANEGTNLSVFSVGRANAVNQGLFKDVPYDGLADIAGIAIASSDGKFGGLRSANASYFNTRGFTGVYAPGVQFLGPVFIGDINASDSATSVLLLGAAGNVRITGGDLAQANGGAVQVSGFSQLVFADGSTSHSTTANLPAQTNKGRLEQNGADVTQQIVVNPSP